MCKENHMSDTSMKTVSTEFVDRLVRGICHDMGAPTRHIVQFSQMLNNSPKGKVEPEKQLKWLSFINDSGLKAQEMLSSLSKLSMISSSQATESLNLRFVFEQVVDNLKLNNMEQWKTVELTVNEQWPVVEGVRSHWQLLFTYLLQNAVLFQPKDADHSVFINVQLNKHNDMVYLEVDDNGIGLTEYQMAEATKPFKRFNPVEDYDGIGMGLTYCDYISQLNNGSIDFKQSELGGLKVTYRQACFL